MRNPQDIILAPIVTERSMMQTAEGKYTFRVDPKATKTEIRQACEQLFKVKVLKVNTMNISGKSKRMGYHTGVTPSWKKAVVSIDQNPQAENFLAEGGKSSTASKEYKDSIEEFGFGV